MLITSERHTIADLQAWKHLERYDERLSAGLPDLEQRAMRCIHQFASSGDCYATTSWGKDSTVMVDLIGRTGLKIPIVQLVINGYEMPGTTQVRDIMLERHPHLQYDELTLPPQPNRWWDTKTIKRSKYDADIGWRLIAQRYGTRRMTGIRAEESRLRTMVQQRWGDASTNAARPVGTWAATDIFAYLHTHKLPVHPAYGMSQGGKLDRRWIRVHALGGVTGADRGRADWEEAYFGDTIQESRTRDAVMAALPTNRNQAVIANTIATSLGLPTPQVQHAISTAHKTGKVGARTYAGITRYWRQTPWPPQPQWLRPEPPQEGLFT